MVPEPSVGDRRFGAPGGRDLPTVSCFLVERQEASVFDPLGGWISTVVSGWYTLPILAPDSHVDKAFGSDIGVGTAQIFVPNASTTSTTAFTLGVLAMYGMVVSVFTTWPKRLLPRSAWHVVHLVAFPVAVMTGIHAYLLGTDTHTSWYTMLTLALVAIVMYPVGLRVSGLYRRSHARTIRHDTSSLRRDQCRMTPDQCRSTGHEPSEGEYQTSMQEVADVRARATVAPFRPVPIARPMHGSHA